MFSITCGDVLASLKIYPTNTFDACLSDPPYSLGFMNMPWDKASPSVETLGELLRVLKPGAHALLFGGTRTWHRLATNAEDAGFELRDTVMWFYGSGLPKSLNLEKATGDAAWQGHGTALKPAWEPVMILMKPLDRTFAANAAKWGVAGLNIDACKIGAGGRFPANVILDDEAGVALDLQTGILKSGKMKAGTKRATRAGNALGKQCATTLHDTIGDSGGASRFFYCAKASAKERNAGMPAGAKNGHPTLKPLALTEYLARLILPPLRANGTPRRLIVPYSGGGSEMIGALMAGWDEAAGIELSPVYAKTARNRLQHFVSEHAATAVPLQLATAAHR